MMELFCGAEVAGAASTTPLMVKVFVPTLVVTVTVLENGAGEAAL